MGNEHSHSHIRHDKTLQKLSSNTGFSTLNSIYNKYTFEFPKDLNFHRYLGNLTHTQNLLGLPEIPSSGKL